MKKNSIIDVVLKSRIDVEDCVNDLKNASTNLSRAHLVVMVDQGAKWTGHLQGSRRSELSFDGSGQKESHGLFGESEGFVEGACRSKRGPDSAFY